MSYTPLKDQITQEFLQPFILVWQKNDSDFNATQFVKEVFNKNWGNLELKERQHHLANCCHTHLKRPFPEAINFLILLLRQLDEKEELVGRFEYFFIPDYILLFGLKDFQASLDAMKKLTKYVTCEFAVRPFLIENQTKCLAFLDECANDQHQNVRRFASEACRPLLPWGQKLHALVGNPKPIFSILNQLMEDKAVFVQKSVANNLNDITKSHPDLVLEFCKKWFGKSSSVNWIIKHACRTLLKNGNASALSLFDYADSKDLVIEEFKVLDNNVQFGNALNFQFRISNHSGKTAKTRLEYCLYFLRKNGQVNRKVFKLSEKSLSSGESILIKKKHSIQEISTRTYYPGEQQLSIQINGEEKVRCSFILVMK